MFTIKIEDINQYLYLLGITIFLYFVRNLILNFLKERILENKNYRLYKIYINYIFLLIIILFYTPVFLPSIKEFITILSIFGAGILLIFKEVFLNFYSFFYILVRKPFYVGDRIQIQNLYGDVLDVRLLDFSILQLYPLKYGGQSSGRIIHIPNSYILLNPVINFSKEFALNWLEIMVPFTLKSDWKHAEQIIEGIVKKISYEVNPTDPKIDYSKKEYNIQYSKLTPKMYVEFAQGTILLTVRFLCEPKQQRIVKDIFWRELLDKINQIETIQLHENFDNRIQF